MSKRKVGLITLAPLATALLVATAGAQTRPAPTPTAGDLGPPTVLPTIIGVRPRATQGSKAVSRSIPYPTMITAAGPVYSTLTGQLDPVEEAAPVGEPVPVEAPVPVPFYWRDGLRYGGRERFHSRRWQNRLEQTGWHEQNGGGRTGLSPSPRLAPAPRLSPSPALPPVTGRSEVAGRKAEPAPVAHAAPAMRRP